MRRLLVLALMAALAMVAIPRGAAFALSTDVRVLPGDKEFSVSAMKLDNGRIEFTIMRKLDPMGKLDPPLYVIAGFELRKAGELVAETTSASGPLDGTETWHLSIPKDYLPGSYFVYAVNNIPARARPDGGVYFPVVGRTSSYRIRLGDFPIAGAPAKK